jgi:hypothetical protein
LALYLSPPPGPVCASFPDYPVMDLRPLLAPKSEAPDMGFLFRQCLNPSIGLREDDYQEVAAFLSVEIAAIKAVAEVETGGKAFDDYGRPRILFERHYFHRLTGGKHDAEHPVVSNAKAGGYGKFSAQYDKLEEAFRLDPEAALRAASWGRFQIMGDNFRAAGFASVRSFALAMTRSEAEQLWAFAHFVKSNGKMLSSLRKKDWAGFAAAYNGPGYANNAYDKKMAEAYRRFAPPPSAAPPTQPPTPPTLP